MIADANFANTLLNLVLFVLASTRPMTRAPLVTLILLLACQFALAQQTNPVDRKVANPMTDTPNVNPLNDISDTGAFCKLNTT